MRTKPPKLTPDVHKKILGYINAGAYIETAAAAAGISKQTFYNWLHWANRPDAEPEYKKFAEEIEQALAADEIRGVLQLETLAGGKSREVECTCGAKVSVKVPGNVQLNAITWKLERKYPDRYGGLIRIEHKVKGAVQEVIEAARPFMKPETYADFVQAISQAMAADGMDPPTAEGGGEPEAVQH